MVRAGGKYPAGEAAETVTREMPAGGTPWNAEVHYRYRLMII
jgi:hypothetical protein